MRAPPEEEVQGSERRLDAKFRAGCAMVVQSVVSGDGTEIAYAVSGSGPPVLLIHGFPDDHTLWAAQAEAIVTAGMQAVAVDQRGFGSSGKPSDATAYRLHLAMADMLVVLDELGHDRAAVVGHDWGAAVASVVAMFAPERVDRLVLISAGHPGVFRTLGLRQFELAWYMQFFQAPEIPEEWLKADNWANLKAWGRHPEPDEVIARLSEPGALTAALNWYRANAGPEMMRAPTRPLPRFTQPTMGIWASDDPHLIEEFVTGTADLVDNSWRYERIEDAGHWVQLDQPEALSRLLVDYLQSDAAQA